MRLFFHGILKSGCNGVTVKERFGQERCPALGFLYAITVIHTVWMDEVIANTLLS